MSKILPITQAAIIVTVVEGHCVKQQNQVKYTPSLHNFSNINCKDLPVIDSPSRMGFSGE